MIWTIHRATGRKSFCRGILKHPFSVHQMNRNKDWHRKRKGLLNRWAESVPEQLKKKKKLNGTFIQSIWYTHTLKVVQPGGANLVKGTKVHRPSSSQIWAWWNKWLNWSTAAALLQPFNSAVAAIDLSEIGLFQGKVLEFCCRNLSIRLYLVSVFVWFHHIRWISIRFWTEIFLAFHYQFAII